MLPHAPYSLTAFSITQGRGLGQLITGPDGNVWILIAHDASTGSLIARLNPKTGQFTYFNYNPDKAQSYSGIAAITVGPDRHLWIAGGGTNTIVILNPFGSDNAIQTSLHDYDLPTPHSIPDAITSGPDGSLWFVEKGVTRAVATITTSGRITEFPLPADNCPSSDFFGLPGRACQPSSITRGPDGDFWIVENGANAMVRMDSHIRIISGNVNSVRVAPGETALLYDANVAGDVTANGSSGVFICSSIIHGNVNVANSTGNSFIGNVPDEYLPCQGGQIGGSLTLTNNQGGFGVGQYTISGDLTVTGNYDGRLTTADAGLRIDGNTIGGNLACTGNNPTSPVNDGATSQSPDNNTVKGLKSGQCAGLH